MGVSQLLGGRAGLPPTKVYDCAQDANK